MSVAHIVREYEEKNQQQADQAERGPKREVFWSEARIFVAKPGSSVVSDLAPGADLTPFAGCVMVGIKKSDHRDFPNYRVAIGAVLAEGRFVPGISPRADLDALRIGTIQWDGAFASLRTLLVAAEDWINTDQGYNVNRFIDRKGGEGRDGNVKASHKTGKTERNRTKGKAKPRKD